MLEELSRPSRWKGIVICHHMRTASEIHGGRVECSTIMWTFVWDPQPFRSLQESVNVDWECLQYQIYFDQSPVPENFHTALTTYFAKSALPTIQSWNIFSLQLNRSDNFWKWLILVFILHFVFSHFIIWVSSGQWQRCFKSELMITTFSSTHSMLNMCVCVF